MSKGPDFIGIGPPRTASTWIFECLGEHPQIHTPFLKEPTFFHRKNWQTKLGWYESLFEQKPPQKKITGEYSTQYFPNSERAARRISSRYPRAKLICCLRNPIERAFSFFLYLHYVHGLKENFEQMLANNTTNVLTAGNYTSHLKNYWQYFSKSQLFIAFYDDLLENPIKFIQNIYSFLEVDANFIPRKKIKTKINAGIIPKYPMLNWAINTSRRFLFTHGYFKTISFLKKTGLREFLTSANNQKIDRYKLMDLQTRKWLSRYYNDEIRKLEAIFNRDLSHWK